MDAKIESTNHGNIVVFKISGELTEHALTSLKKEIISHLENKEINQVVVNLQNIDYMSSRDLGAFVQIFKYMHENCEGEPVLALSNPTAFVENVLEMTKLNTIFQVFKTEEDAIAALQ